jgi:hypothetical protein
MTLHHFVPLSVITTFASDQVWRVVKAAPEIRARIAISDKAVIAGGQKRNWPICIYEKDRKSITRKLAKDVCSAPNLYGVLDYEDQLIRALIRYNLQAVEIPLGSLDDLLQLGEKILDPDMIEKTQVGEIDASFAGVLPVLRTGQQISDTQISIILRFVTFARFRTPAWRRVHYPETYERTQKQLKDLFIRNWNESQIKKLSGRSLEAINITIDNHLYQMAIIQACSRETNALRRINAKVIALHRTGTTPFVTCDNPARPYFPDRLRRIDMEAFPGMGNPRSQITYPVDPNTCLLVSSNPAYSAFTHQEVKDKQVQKINCALALMADREIIFAGPNTDVFEKWLDLSLLKPIRRP